MGVSVSKLVRGWGWVEGVGRGAVRNTKKEDTLVRKSEHDRLMWGKEIVC